MKSLIVNAYMAKNVLLTGTCPGDKVLCTLIKHTGRDANKLHLSIWYMSCGPPFEVNHSLGTGDDSMVRMSRRSKRIMIGKMKTCLIMHSIAGAESKRNVKHGGARALKAR